MAINPFLALRGGMNLAAGAIRNSRLDMLSDNVRSQRDVLLSARKDQDAALEALQKNPSDVTNLVAFAKAQVASDKATYDALNGQAILDRAQNEQAGYQVIQGGLELGDAFFGGGGGGGGGMGGGMDPMALLSVAAAGGVGGYLGSRSGVPAEKP